MASTSTTSNSNGLYNEDRNLLRIRERERRNQEAHQERETFPENAPLFAEPYKINKADELSSRIQNMLGNYEEVNKLISTKTHQNLIGIRTSVVSLIPHGKPDRPFFPEKTSSTFPPSFQDSSHHHQPMGPPPPSAPHSSRNSVYYQKFPPRTEPSSSLHTKSNSLSKSQTQGPEHSSHRDSRSGSHQKKSGRRAKEDDDDDDELQASLSELSPLLSTLSSPIAPLSPLHSNQHINFRPQGNSKSHGQTYSQVNSPPQEPVVGSHDNETWDGLAPALGVATQPSSQTFPPSLPSKTSAMQRKPTAYVRPMDGQDQVPNESPELKPLPEEYHEQPYGKIPALKTNAKPKLSKLKISSEPIEQSFPNEVQCVEEILKEMTHSWPPPLTAIHTPSTAEPSKFPFPIKESQHTGSAIQNQKQYDAPSKTVSQQGTSMLIGDLEISDSEDSDDDQVCEKPPPSSIPTSAPQSQPDSVASAHSSSAESGSTSDSDTSTDSESESGSSDSETNDPPTRASTPEPDPPTSNKWQLDNWLTKVNQPVVPTESLGEVAHASNGHQKSKEQGKNNSNNNCLRQCPESKESHSKNLSKAPRAPPELHLPTKRTCPKYPTYAEEPPQRQTVGTKQPKKPAKVTAPAAPQGGLKVESEPGSYGAKDQPSKDKPKVKTKGRPKSSDKKEPKPTAQEPPEKTKHKSSPHPTVKVFLDPEPVKDSAGGSAPEHFPTSPLAQSQGRTATSRTSGNKPALVVREDFHKDKFLLPFRDKKLSPLRDLPVPHALVVKIELFLLSRVPQPQGKGNRQKKLEAKEPPDVRKPELEARKTDPPRKSVKRRKQGDVEREADQKKIKLEKDSKSLSSSRHKDFGKMKVTKPSSETQNKDHLLPPPPMSPAQKPAKVAQKRPKGESNPCSQLTAPSASTAKTKSSHKESSSSKHRKVEGKHVEHSKSNKGSAGDATNPFPVPSLPNGTSKPMRPQIKPEKQHPVEYHIKEAKRLKHKADAMTDKVGKAFKYLDAALSFIECGIAIESYAMTPKQAYTMFAETIDLLKFVMTLKSFADSSTSTHEKIFAVLCMRCQAILYMAMFRYKKDTALKYFWSLNEHFKSSSRITQAPSPCVARGTGTPSPLSPMPSPASSVSSQPGSNAGSCGNSSVSTLYNIPAVTSSYVSITSYILYAYDIWEHADALARKNKEFFAELNAAACTLSLNSSMPELVHYTRQGLQWLRLEANTP
uniref:ALF transcription elongation factor 1 n=1 Tax=Sphenodon punctatus TaxID=8508 RepID=A0A8D0GA08_SPHPU